ncbi:hypothetical protein NLI96_g55 [Meripilus lineatus]|uniref:Uncharacterized protein n=1 Tax=Meripilus lineatus TaxID=2056292 RepID=A0AAD5YP91_9APHY|nr:hypothetical protein NLI96_g55 [Physisporinus lineatus]
MIPLTRFLVLSEMFATKLFEYVSRATNAPSSGVFPASESAVAIIGEDDVTETVDERTVELGCSLALGFSEAGYTVFTLYRMKSQGDIQGTSSAPSANLLYVWHKKKERSGHPAWGLVAPIVLDTQSKPFPSPNRAGHLVSAPGGDVYLEWILITHKSIPHNYFQHAAFRPGPHRSHDVD